MSPAALIARARQISMQSAEDEDSNAKDIFVSETESLAAAAAAAAAAASASSPVTAGPAQPLLRARQAGTPLLHDSWLLSYDNIEKLIPILPPEYHGHKWTLLYRLLQHGKGLVNFYARVQAEPGTLVLVRTTEGPSFGFFAAAPWRTKEHVGYYGSGDCFVFQLEPMFMPFSWSRKNKLFQMSTKDSLAMGGGGSFAIYLDKDLCGGTTGPCATFSSPALGPSRFTVQDMECWGFSVNEQRFV